jgi:type I restriction enzyme S subunit
MLPGVRPDHLGLVLEILGRRVPGREVWAFGSRVRGTFRATSDLDLAILGDEPLSFELLAALRDDFSESNIPYKVDVVDWAATTPEFRGLIEAEYSVVQAEDARGRRV